MEAKHHFDLSKFNVPKKKHIDPDPVLTENAYDEILESIGHKGTVKTNN